jgi:lipopolysaccharide/colanic/teichoic acid biosynthesis glycosyltransferase
MNNNFSLYLSIHKVIFNLSKRLIDFFGSLILLTVFSPLMFIVAVLIKISSPGPIIFRQLRVGQNKEFDMYKFRSMYIGDNDKFLKEKYPKLWEKYKKSDWKLPASQDPRITPIGKFIRATSVDEMPQFLNVLKGEMSLVGPRAYRNDELKEYAQKYPDTREHIRDIRSVKPGITGPWQVSGRNDLPFEKRARLDSEYIRHRSLLKEIIIILKTPAAMLSGW